MTGEILAQQTYNNISVIVYPERVEIKGTIPKQILDKVDKEKTAPIIKSPPLRKEGEEIEEGLASLLSHLIHLSF